MIKSEQIPEVVWRVAMMTYHREIRRNPEQAWQLAIAAAINAWPGMEERTSGHYPNGIGGPGEVVERRIILPLKQEGE